MTLKVQKLNGEEVVSEFPGNKYELRDTLDDWIIKDSGDRVVAIYSKFTTVNITLIPDVKQGG